MAVPNEVQQGQRVRDRFRRTVWLQVYLPLLAGVGLVIALVAVGLMRSTRGGPTTSGMADTALVALLLPMMLLGMIGLAALVLLAVGVGRVIDWIPERGQMVRRVAGQVVRQADQIASRVVRVIIAPKSAWHAGGTFLARLVGRE